jgi:DNA gyrase/topoisomerase IV subunit B
MYPANPSISGLHALHKCMACGCAYEFTASDIAYINWRIVLLQDEQEKSAHKQSLLVYFLARLAP